jgi:alpha,alpha-trehalase
MRLLFCCLSIVVGLLAKAQATPDKVYGELFHAIQRSGIFPDSKTFVDCTPKRNPAAIVADYQKIIRNPAIRFSLQKFVEENFDLPPAPPAFNNIRQEPDVRRHIIALWSNLRREKYKPIKGSSLLPLPNDYIVPGGRFREIYYWDSYFTMLGLLESAEEKMIEQMVDNFAFLIQQYGHIPNGSRSYYLSRSQPPFFSLMVELMVRIKGEKMYLKYLPALEKEYAYWMSGASKCQPGKAVNAVVKLKNGTLLNRYYDALAIPRQEGFLEDEKTATEAANANSNRPKKQVMDNIYKNLRAGAASGWDFSSRWFADTQHISTIQVLDIAPVDLNSLLLNHEMVLVKAYGVARQAAKQKQTQQAVQKRAAALQQYFFNKEQGYFFDYNFVSKTMSQHTTAAGMFPLCFLPLDDAQLKALGKTAATVLQAKLLQPGGVVCTEFNTGQQWDAPNGWAPLQWMSIWALNRCGENKLAEDIAQRWVALNKKVYKATGKLMEKYNVVDLSKEAGGGEYPGQDGFGWTNGVLLALMNRYQLLGE